MISTKEVTRADSSRSVAAGSKGPSVTLGALMDCGGEQRLFTLDGIRAIAISMVFLVHLATLFQRALSNGTAAHVVLFLGVAGNSGVDLFFVISGFLIYPRVLRFNFQYAKFIRRRIRRIYPTFLAVLALYLGLSVIFPAESKIHGHPVSTLAYILENAFLLPGMLSITPIMTVAWSLSYEMAFYIALPLIIATARFRRLSAQWRLAALLLFSSIVLLLPSLFIARYRLIMFLFGAVVYEVNCLKPRLPLSRTVDMGLVLLLALGFITSGLPRKSFVGDYRITALSYSAFLLLIISSQGAVSKLLCSAPLRRLGNMSYSYYLIHGLVLKLLASAAYRMVAPGAMSLSVFISFSVFAYVLTILAATTLFLAVERPISMAPKDERPRMYLKQELIPALGQCFSWSRPAEKPAAQGIGM